MAGLPKQHGPAAMADEGAGSEGSGASDMADFLDDVCGSSDDGELPPPAALLLEPEPEPEPAPPAASLLAAQPELSAAATLAAQLERWLPEAAGRACPHRPATISVQQAGLKCTGGWVWEGAKELDAYLLHSLDSFEGLKVLELGAGGGWLAQRLGSVGATVVATEQAEMLPMLQLNIAKNAERAASRGSSDGGGPTAAAAAPVESAELDWLDVERAAAANSEPMVVVLTRSVGGWDLIVGSDCVYIHEFFGPLLLTIAAAAETSISLKGKAPRVLLSAEHRTRSHVTVDRNLAPAVFFGDPTNAAEEAACAAATWDLGAFGFESAAMIWENQMNVQGNRASCYELRPLPT